MARSRNRERLYIGIGGHVVAIDAASGEEIWRTKVKGSMFVTVFMSGREVYAGANGELFCLRADTGEIVWHNKLKGLGMGVIGFAGSDAQVAMSAAITAAATAAAAG
jgi:outer membrane protein assembly factor BamB